VDERAKRLARNEDRFREANERLEQAVAAGGTANGGRVEFLCECADLDCTESVAMTLTDYRRLRSDATWFAVRPGHEVEDVEQVVARGDGYLIVAKRADAGREAERLDG
jgi:hypothetical protein